jgi:lactoylglutathione lyase
VRETRYPARSGGNVTVVAVHSSFPILYVDDVAVAVRFYRDLLGFEELYRFPDGDEPGYVALGLDDGKIGLSSAAFPGIHGKAQRPVTGRPFELCLEVEDVDGLVEDLRRAGVVVLADAADQVWGERVAYVEDPDGNPVHLRGPITPAR